MGYNPISTNTQLIAKLTPLGRQLMVTNTNSLITSFTLGDSDAFYDVTNGLSSGQVPAMGGNLGLNASTSNSVGSDTAIRYPIYYNSVGSQTKQVEASSVNISSTLSKISESNVTLTISSLSQNLIDRNDYDTNGLVNLFSSFGLPLTENQKTNYTGKTFSQGGFSNTALSGFATDKILVIGIDNNFYGENLDGREIRVDITTSAASYTLYSTFQNTGLSTRRQDANYKDSSDTTRQLGLSLGFLMCDSIKPPSGNPSLSWATGFGANKPFSVGKKQLYNLQTNTNLALTADTVTGIAYLSKGLLVITDPTIVGEYNTAFSGTSATTVTFNSVATSVSQNITCIAGRGEFANSINPSWSAGQPVAISELGLYDKQNRLIAYGKFDRHVLKNSDSFMSFGVKISV